MAPLAVLTPPLSCPLLPAKATKRAKYLSLARHSRHQPSPVSSCRRSLWPSFKADFRRQVQEFYKSSPIDKGQPTNHTVGVVEFFQQQQKLFATTTLGASLLMVALPANALIELPSIWVQQFIIGLVMGFSYLFLAPLLIYYYLHKRWYKRKMPEAIFQFWLVFMFFPGLLLFAPFINLRMLPQEGVKEPWDEMPRR